MAIDAKTTAVPDILVATGRTLGQLNSIATTSASNITTLQGNITSITGDLSALSGTVTTLSGTVTTHTSNISDLQASDTSTATTIGTIQDNVTTLQGDTASLDGRLNTLELSSHAAVTLSGETYLSMVGQAITASDINLTSHVTGTLPIASGGTGQTGALAAFNALKQAATTTYAGVVELATDGESASGLALQSNDSRLHSAVTLAGQNYLGLSGQQITANQVNLTSHVTGTLPLGSGGTGETTGAAAFGAIKQNASDTATGVVELATNAEVVAGTDTARAITPAGAAAAYQPLDTELTALAGVTSAANALPYFSGSGAATVTTLSSFARTLIDDGDAATMQETLGLGGMATQAPGSVSISGGSISGITDLGIADGGTGASTAAAAFGNLKQPASEAATGVVELATVEEAQAGTDTARAVTPAGLAAAAPPVTLTGETYLSLSGQQITASDVNLASHITGNLPVTHLNSGTNASATTYWRGDGTWATPAGGGGGITTEEAQDSIGAILTDTTSINFTYDDATPSITAAAIFGTTAGTVAEGNHNHDTAYQPLDAELTALSGLTSAADKLPYFTGDGTATTTTLSNFGRTLIDDADAGTGRGTLGLGTIATQNSDNVTISGGSITGVTALGIGVGGTGQTTAAAAFNALKQAASTTATGVVELATDGEVAAGLAVQSNDSRLHAPVTVSGSPAYFTLSGQDLVRGFVNLGSHVTGNLPASNLGSGTNASATTFLRGDMTWVTPTDTDTIYTDEQAQDAAGAMAANSTSINLTYNDATPSLTATANFGTAAGTVAEGNHNHNAAYQPLDAELTALAGLTSAANALPYFSGAGTATTTTLSAFGRTLIDDADAATAQGTLGLGTISTQSAASVAITGGSVTGITDLAIADGGTGASTAAAAFSNLKQAASTTATGVVELATDGENAANVVVQGNDSRLHVAVTLAGSPDYITISGQQITRALISLSSHVTGTLPISSVGGLSTSTETGTSHTNAAGDKDVFLRWTNTGAKTYTVVNNVASDTHAWQGRNCAASGNLTLVAGSGVTLNGDLVFAPGRSYTIRFYSASTADVIGGTAS